MFHYRRSPKGWEQLTKSSIILHVALDGQVHVLRGKTNEWHLRPVASPYGRRLAFATMPFHGNVWMIEDF